MTNGSYAAKSAKPSRKTGEALTHAIGMCEHAEEFVSALAALCSDEAMLAAGEGDDLDVTQVYAVAIEATLERAKVAFSRSGKLVEILKQLVSTPLPPTDNGTAHATEDDEEAPPARPAPKKAPTKRPPLPDAAKELIDRLKAAGVAIPDELAAKIGSLASKRAARPGKKVGGATVIPIDADPDADAVTPEIEADLDARLAELADGVAET